MTPQVKYKKGHDERKAKYTSLPDPPEMVLARTVDEQRSDVRYHHPVVPKYYDPGLELGGVSSRQLDSRFVNLFHFGFRFKRI